ncbi:Transcriptional adapter ada2, partial [Blyttiomyces sp. JEL0837]
AREASPTAEDSKDNREKGSSSRKLRAVAEEDEDDVDDGEYNHPIPVPVRISSKDVPPVAPVDDEILKAYCVNDKKSNYVVTWTKNIPIPVTPSTPGMSELDSDELRTCEVLRLAPLAYLTIKKTLLSARHHRGTFKKRDAQRWCRVDVNKTGKIFDWFISKGWLISPPPGRSHPSVSKGDPR